MAEGIWFSKLQSATSGLLPVLWMGFRISVFGLRAWDEDVGLRIYGSGLLFQRGRARHVAYGEILHEPGPKP